MPRPCLEPGGAPAPGRAMPNPFAAPSGEAYARRLDALLAAVQAPGRYVGGEVNARAADPSAARLRVALSYPDLYAVGMSHLGLAVLYDLANAVPGVAAERVFAPAPDFEAALYADGLPLATLESRTPLARCDLIGFSLSHELAATGLLTVLAAGGVPVTRAERRARAAEGPWPLVVAGGHAAMAPEPWADFVDAFFIGEAEESWPDALGLLRDAGGRGEAMRAPEAFLARLVRAVPGVYAPALYATETRGDGVVLVRASGDGDGGGGAPFPVARRAVDDLDRFAPPAAPVVPTAEAAHERVVLEIMRGCPNGCRFCQAGFVTRPARARSVAPLCDAARRGLAATGYDEIGLLSLSASDHPRLAELADALDREFGPRGVSLSLPSLRVDSALAGIIPRLRSVRPTGLTVAPEAGSERLRAVINKDVADDTLLDAARRAYAGGFAAIKLYFMVGLPTETDEDVVAIARLAGRVADQRPARAKRGRAGGRAGGRAAVTVSVANFVPKPHTPFQWEPAVAPDELERRHRLVADRLDRRRVDLARHDARTSRLEAALARGDRRLGAVVRRAWESGARLDAWTEHFRPDLWDAAFAAEGLSASAYAAGAGHTPGGRTPWDHIDGGASPAFLAAERARAHAGERTPACAPGRCAGCGVPVCAFRDGAR